MFFLFSGAAASGKTTIAKNLAGRVAGLECHDADEKRAADEFARCRQLEEWVQLALQAQSAGCDFLLAGQSPLGELLACPSAPRLAGIAACLLDCDDTTRITRMRQRGIDPRWPPDQDAVSWAAWHRLHAWDPQWQQHVILGNGPADHNYARWTAWSQNDPRWQVQVIDSTALSIEQVLAAAAAWVAAERAQAPRLSPQTAWWK
jgi:hypothetical protein